MGKSSEKDGAALLETPARVESAPPKRNINFTYRRHRRSKKEITSSRNVDEQYTKKFESSIGNHLGKVGNRLGFPDDETSHDENKDEISCLGVEKGEVNIFADVQITRGSRVSAATLTLPGCWMAKGRPRKVPKTNQMRVSCRTWNMIPKVDIDVEPWGIPDPKMTENVNDIKHFGCPQSLVVYHRRKQGKQQVCSSSSTDACKGPNKRVMKRIVKPVLVKSKHPRSRKDNMKYPMDRKNKKPSDNVHGMLVPYKEIVHLTRKAQSTAKVEFDKRTVREWGILMEKPDSEGVEEPDEGEREWWEKERELLHERVKSFISSMHLIQGERQFSKWKGSVMDSIGGAYLTQNVNDTLSSSAFMSLAAKYPHGRVSVNSPVEASIGFPSVQPNGENASWRSSSKMKDDNKILLTVKKKKKNAVSSKSIQKGNPVETEDTCLETQTNSKRKRMKKEHDTIHWNTLKSCYSKFHIKKKTYETSDALDWDAVRMAEVDDISKAIQIRGMNNNLAARIKNCLNILVKDLGCTDMEWIRDIPPHMAKKHLLGIPGLGLKSVECIRLLTLRQKAFPVDRNAGRVAVRLGWVLLEPLPEGQEFHLLKEYPNVNSVQMYLWPRLCKLDPSILYELHCQMITFGKVFCTKRNPNCNACPMKAECKHFASILASAQLALPSIQEKNDTHPSNFMALPESLMVSETAMVPLLKANCTTSEFVPEAENVTESQCFCPKCLQMVEVPGSDALRLKGQPIEGDIEDFGLNGIPRIRFDEEMLKENIQKFMNENNVPLQEGEMSKDLIVLTSEMASIPVPKLKNVIALRTEHQVYVLPDWHHVLAELEERDPVDSCPHLLAIWTPENLNKEECITEEDAVYGTLLIPVRTAMRGMFPLNGTFFQANEVFADDESSEVPIKVPRALLWHLPCMTLYCGNNISAICRGMTTFEVQKCFRRGFVCFRGFNRKTREPKSLSARFHLPASKVEKPRSMKKKHRTAMEREENDA